MGAIERIRAEVQTCPEVEEFIDFILNTKRGISPGRRLKTHSETGDATPENA